MNSTTGDGKNIIVLSADRHLKLRVIFSDLQGDFRIDSIMRDFIKNTLDILGQESAKAQQLQVPITTTLKFTSSSCDDLVFFILNMTNSSRLADSPHFNALGFIRFGRRELYCSDGNGLRHLANCPSILDFYIRPKRCGYGKMLFDLLVQQLKLKPPKLAYDRPSESMIAFLRKHYALAKPLWQHNHYVIFNDIWQ